MNKLSIYISLGLLLLFSAAQLSAQSTYRLSENSKMVIKGTSSLHDWESDVESVRGEGIVALENQQARFQDFNMSIPVTSIKSGKSAMDKNTYEALQEEKYPTIEFSLNQIESLSRDKIRASGKLSIAGKIRPVTLTANYDLHNADLISLKGSYTMKMTDFGVEPPTAVFGTIKTGDEITIDYNLQLEKTNQEVQ